MGFGIREGNQPPLFKSKKVSRGPGLFVFFVDNPMMNPSVQKNQRADGTHLCSNLSSMQPNMRCSILKPTPELLRQAIEALP